MKTYESPNLASLVALIFHLMTCYHLRPCPRLAAKVAEHLEVLLGNFGEVFGPWQGTLDKMREHWQLRAGMGWKAGERKNLN